MVLQQLQSTDTVRLAACDHAHRSVVHQVGQTHHCVGNLYTVCIQCVHSVHTVCMCMQSVYSVHAKRSIVLGMAKL